jgi:hypothetical protein
MNVVIMRMQNNVSIHTDFKVKYGVSEGCCQFRSQNITSLFRRNFCFVSACGRSEIPCSIAGRPNKRGIPQPSTSLVCTVLPVLQINHFLFLIMSFMFILINVPRICHHIPFFFIFYTCLHLPMPQNCVTAITYYVTMAYLVVKLL